MKHFFGSMALAESPFSAAIHLLLTDARIEVPQPLSKRRGVLIGNEATKNVSRLVA
jgi:hypothetical protein